MAVPVLLVISFIAFMLIYYSPGDAIDRMMASAEFSAARGEDMDVEYLLHLKHIFGLDQPWYIQYFQWLKQFVQGNLGLSFSTGRPVIEELMIRLPCTLSYQIVALILSVAVAIPAGVISAIKRNTRTDTYIVMGSLFGASFPPFVTGLLLMFLFSLILGWLPSGGTHSWQLMGRNVPHDLSYYLDYLKHMILPTLTLTVVNVGYLTRMIRSSMLNVLTEDYVIAARSRGLKERVVIYKHALKNAMLPVMTVIGLRVAYMISGAPVIERIFSWPGLGNYFVRAVQTRDYFSVVGAAIMLGVVILVANLVIDLSYKWLDPRVNL